MTALCINTKRSFESYLSKLTALNWVGFDKNTHTYYIRSFKVLRVQAGYQKYLSAVFQIEKDASSITQFVQGALVCYHVKRRMQGRKTKIAKFAGSSALKNGSAIQELTARGDISGHVGFSLEKLGKLLNVSKSQADRYKKRLQTEGYIKTRKKYNVLFTSDKPDFYLFTNLPTNRIYDVKKRRREGKTFYEFRERTFDEFIPLMLFRCQKSIVRRLKNAK